MRFLRMLLAAWLTGCALSLWLPALGQDRYLADLTSPDRRMRRRAAAALGARRFQAAVPALLVTLKDDLDAGARAEAAIALGKIKAPEAIPPLIQALREPDADVRRAALRALLLFSIEEDIEFVFARRRGLDRFNPFLETDEPTIALTGTVVSPEILQAIADAMRDDPNLDNRRSAARALGVLRGDAMISALVEALGDPELRDDIFRVFAKLGRPEYGIHVLPYLDDRDDRVRQRAIETVGRLRSREAVAPLMARYRAARHGDRQQAQILAALARIGDPASEPIFRENLSHQSAERRRFAAEGLGRGEAVAYVNSILNNRLTEKDESTRLAQAFALYRMGRAEFLQEVITQLDSLRHGEQAESYLYSLARNADLHPHLRRVGPRGAERMMRALGRIGTRDDLPALQPLLRDGDRRIANAANRAIRQIELRAEAARD
ncbi:MAG: hypothetical protein CFK52_04245 [Chloracidobacterium sp. CP2_5A]|nr:MAG: hypothetical protein CFK52_04245 [Chloracidobacterium sp. CP2_5A]